MYYKLFGFLFLPIIFGIGCVKEKTCNVTKVITVQEVRIDSIYVQRQYIVELECYE